MKIFKSLLVLLLLLPTTVLAQEVPNEVTINEDFSDSSYQNGLTISGGNQAAYIYTGENDSYNTTGNSLAIMSGTYLFEFTEDVYEVGFMVAAVNNAYSVTWNYADNTSETENKSGQSTSNFDNMYDDFYKSFTDYNNDEANTDKFITSFSVTLSDISLLDTLYWQYVEITVTTTSSTTTSSTTTSTTTTSTTTTTTTLPPKPIVYEPPPPPPPPEPTTVIVILDNGEEAEYEEYEVEDGTVDRDNERKKNYDLYGVELTDAQIERGDLELYDTQKEDLEQVTEELPNDDFIYDDLEDEYVEEEYIELTKEEILELEKQVEIELKELEEESIILVDSAEIIEDLKLEGEDLQDFIDTIQELEEIDFEEEFAIEDEEFVLEEIITEDIIIIDDKEIKEEDIFIEAEEESQVVELADEDISTEEQIKEEIAVEVAEVEEIIQDIIIEEVTTEEVIEVIQEVNDIGVQNLEFATEEVQEIVQAVVVEAIQTVEELTEEQVEVVAEILQVESTEDVQVYAAAAESEKSVEVAIEEYVERSIANADVENYNIADVVSEVNVELFLESPIDAIINVDLSGIELSNIGADMADTQKEKAQEVFAPVVLTQIVAITRRRLF